MVFQDLTFFAIEASPYFIRQEITQMFTNRKMDKLWYNHTLEHYSP